MGAGLLIEVSFFLLQKSRDLWSYEYVVGATAATPGRAGDFVSISGSEESDSRCY